MFDRGSGTALLFSGARPRIAGRNPDSDKRLSCVSGKLRQTLRYVNRAPGQRVFRQDKFEKLKKGGGVTLRLVWPWLGVIAVLMTAPALAAKGDRKVTIGSPSPILAGKVLDLRFAGFAQGIWTRQADDCAALSRIDTGPPGHVVAIYRGLLETPTRICQVYGAEQRPKGAQRAAMNCRLDTGSQALGMVTVRRRGAEILVVQDGENPPITYRFCRTIPPVINTAGQQPGVLQQSN